MKIVLAIVAFAAVYICTQAGLTEEQVEKLKIYHHDCLAETGVDNELVVKARRGEFVEDEKLKRHLYCVGKKIGFMNDAGEIQTEVLKTKLSAAINDDALADKLIEECAIQKSTAEDTAWETVKCYFEKTPTHISIV